MLNYGYDINESERLSIIIYTEGANTERIYFNKLSKLSKNVIVKVVPCCSNTVSVVEQAENDFKDQHSGFIRKDDGKQLYIKSSDNTKYNQVWCVFDEDNFGDRFDNAVHKAKKLGFNFGISNKCFELWLCIHTNLQASRRRCDDYQELLTNHVGARYSKNRKIAETFFEKFIGNDVIQYVKFVEKAIKNAHSLMQHRADERKIKIDSNSNLCQQCGDNLSSCHECCPYTTIHHLVMVILYDYLSDKYRNQIKSIFPALFPNVS